MLSDINSGHHVNGFVALSTVDEKSGVRRIVAEQKNQIQYTWGHIAAMLLGALPGTERERYRINAVYFEFENVLSAGTTVVESTTFAKTLDISYYNSLAANRDFLRVPIQVTPALSTASGYQSLLPVENQTNQLTFFAQTTGATGHGGLSFNANAYSKVYAAALVAAPDIEDQTKDVIFARTVFAADSQVVKDPSSQIGITWTVAFT